MGFVSRLFGTPQIISKREQFIAYAALRLVESHVDGALGSAGFSIHFNRSKLASGQTLDVALAEWHALMISSTFYGLSLGLDTPEKIQLIIDKFQVAFLKKLSDGCRSAFLPIAAQREQEFMLRFPVALKSASVSEALKLSSAMAAHITGHYDELLDNAGLLLDDPITCTAVWDVVLSNAVSTKKLAEGIAGMF